MTNITSCIEDLLGDDSSIDLGDFSACSNFSALSLDLENLSIDNLSIDNLSIDKEISLNKSNAGSTGTSSMHKIPQNLESSRCDSETNFQLPSNLSNVEDCSDVSVAYSISFDNEQPSYSVNTKRKLKSTPRLSIDSSRNSGYSPLAKNVLGVSSRNNKRFSEFFRAEISNLNLNSPSKSLDSLSDKEISFNNLSLDLDKENAELSIDNISALESDKENAELSIDNISSGAKKSPGSSLLSNSKSPHKKMSFNNLSLESDKENAELSIDNISPHSSPGTFGRTDLNDDIDFNIVTPARSRWKGNVIESSDSEEGDEEEDADDEDEMGDFIVDDDKEEDESGDDVSYGQYIDDEAEEGEELPDGNASTSSDDEEFVTPPTVMPEVYYTPKSVRSTPLPKEKPINLYKTPSTFCHPDRLMATTGTGKNNRRKTCLATPLSVITKTGTPGLPNRTYKRNFISAARELFLQFNQEVFGNQLPADLEIKLNKRLNTTAGRCVYLKKQQQYTVYIELSPKVVDCLDRLKETLVHELCHAAAFIVDHKMDNHGPLWRRWAHRVNVKYPELPPVSRCHTYDIKYKYNYTCSEEWCNYKIGRHSRSIDLERARCPLCFSRLKLPESLKTPNKPPNKWTEFVKDNFSKVKGREPASTPHKDLMKILSEEFKQIKLQQTV